MTERNVPVVHGDISEEWESALRSAGYVAIDLETTGLDWRHDAIRTCQLFTEATGPIIVQIDDTVPDRIRDIVMSERVWKVFHHAMFDLRFMRQNWKVQPRAILCTKIASKVVHPEWPEPDSYSLKSLVARYLNVHLNKELQASNWSRLVLSDEQVRYAANDVRYLGALYELLRREAVAEGVADLLDDSLAFIPTRVETDLRGSGDVFAY